MKITVDTNTLISATFWYGSSDKKDDPDDNMILECAIAGNVDCIVSNDKHLAKLKKFRNIPILTPDEFAEKHL